MRRAFAAFTLLLSAGPTLASPSACTQERAVYADADKLFELRFLPVDSQSASATHRFEIVRPGKRPTLDGYVMSTEPVARSSGMVFNQCPEGDVTGEDLAKCTVWEGVIYGEAAGRLNLLPQQGQRAAPEILLSGFGPALVQSSAWDNDKDRIAPWDVFTLKGCGA
ncbi:hypothetical protein [Rhizobium sp. TRM95796]|uniref:hypothetical protein n=1 Tax=Rhizobium sp. TRM95796 TaxID=2979862 RepID=UPI0021E853D7|nr:hypothetical protein [Rhizobium sp. TRM95796]MCV3767322.1 hypothetical protein [Rhizobium sp. TRM95796]